MKRYVTRYSKAPRSARDNSRAMWLVAIGVLALMFIGKLQSFFQSLFGMNQSEAATSGAVNGIQVNKQNLTLSPAQIQFLANDLFEAMDQMGTDEDKIFNAFSQIITKDDMKAVAKAFGVKKYGSWGSGWIGDYLSLKDWLYRELSSSHFQQLQYKLSWI